MLPKKASTCFRGPEHSGGGEHEMLPVFSLSWLASNGDDEVQKSHTLITYNTRDMRLIKIVVEGESQRKTWP